MERWSIDIYKEYFKFSAAHFLIFPDGSAERLHGHNYRVFVEIAAELTPHGLVLDFKEVKPIVRQIVDSLDEHWLVPGQHPVLRWNERSDGVMEVHYVGRYYAAPRSDVIVLPINNTSSENLATWIGRELHQRLRARFAHLQLYRLRLSVEETPGQSGVYLYTADGNQDPVRSPPE